MEEGSVLYLSSNKHWVLALPITGHVIAHNYLASCEAQFPHLQKLGNSAFQTGCREDSVRRYEALSAVPDGASAPK